MRQLKLWADLVAFLRDWSAWRKARRSRPSIAQLKLDYEKARKAHRGQREKLALLRAEVHRRLAAGLGR
jgi:hypothetical protein